MEDKNERKEGGGVRGGGWGCRGVGGGGGGGGWGGVGGGGGGGVGGWGGRVACITPLENGFTKVNITVTAFVCNLCFSYYLLIPIPR